MVALVVSAGVSAATANAVGGRLGTAVGQRNLELRVAARLRDAQQRLLRGDGDAEELKVEVARAKVLLNELRAEADAGRGIKGRDTAPELTPLGFVTKSALSLLRDREERNGGGNATVGVSAAAAAVLVALTWYLFALLQ